MEEQRSAKFPAFPYKPYPIQLDFMNALYDSLNNGGIAMLESPTGTGKTLSIICSALQWLLDTKQQQNSAISNQNRTLGNQSCSDDEPDWMRDFTAKTDDDAPKKEAKEKKKHGIRLKRLQKHRNVDDVREIFDGYNTEGSNMKGKIGEEDVDDGEFLVEDYESEEEGSGSMQSKRKVANSSSDDDNDEEEGGSDEEEEETGLKIYFCSRTHSQLSQFVKELRKTVFARELKVVCLGSRKNFCINEEVLKLGNSTCINERCLELQKNKKNKVTKMKTLVAGGRIRTKASSGCPMLRKQKQQKQFRIEMSESEPLDIEDLVHLGNKLGTCPYYGSRSMTPAADLVILPYQSLLSKTARESLGLNLKNNIVIIDEAHNLADSLISMYDSKITLSQLERVHSHLDKYFQRFRNLLGAGNRRYIQTLLVLTRAFIQTLLHEEEDTTPIVSDSSVAINEFLFSLNIDNINLVKLLHYIKESNIIHKVSGYGEKAAKLQKISTLKDSIEGIEEGSTLSGFQALVNMLLSLTNNDADGRIILSRARPTTFEQRGGYLKYIMLTGEKIFSEITSQAHAVILAGGTLQPIEETRERLFPWLPMDQMQFFSCGHVIPPENILPIAVSNGPSGHSFDFSYNSRSSSSMIEELGLLLCNLSTVVPQGVIVFFSSFDYESHVHDSWKSLGLLQRITKKKRVFREPRRSTEVETVLNQYKETIESISKGDSSPYNGAILLAVVGGKISEGINFSDGMGRCIVMVGLPYPSPSDIELMERVKYIEGLGNSNNTKFPVNNECRDIDFQTGFDVLRSCKNRGREYYENLCMRAVNQSIGRAIRHVNDYAAILLVDARYASDPSKRSFSHPTSKLPQWIKGRLVSKTV